MNTEIKDYSVEELFKLVLSLTEEEKAKFFYLLQGAKISNIISDKQSIKEWYTWL